MTTKQEEITATQECPQGVLFTRPEPMYLDVADFATLFDGLTRHGYTVIGPTIRNGSVVYDELRAVEQLPTGWTDNQAPGEYRMVHQEDPRFFHFNVGLHSWKRFLHLPEITLWRAQRAGREFEVLPETTAPTKRAFLGVRSCEAQAIAIQDRILINDKYRDPVYSKLRENCLIIAVNCSKGGGTCFCASMNTGPKVSQGFDLALTEVTDAHSHYLIVEVGSAKGGELLTGLPARIATKAEVESAESVSRQATEQMGRQVNTTDLPTLLKGNMDHPQWEHSAQRCLTCGNCTMVCPTCFCTTVEDRTDLEAQSAERRRKWDSCFTMDFSYIHGGSIRTSAAARYRQWLTHKFSSWHEQFGMSGCVGCGRCITWCPVGIDVTEEIRAITDSLAPEPALSIKE